VSADVAPVDVLYFPFAQDEQRSEPFKENVPDKQTTQSPIASWSVAVVVSVRNVPAGQEMQVLEVAAAATVL
jgi:hypothetical protein